MGRSHELIDLDAFPGVTVIFSVRESIADTVFSMFTKHLPRDLADLDLLEYFKADCDIELVEEFLRTQAAWYIHYEKYLKPESHVLSFECWPQMIANNRHHQYDRSELINNRQQVLDCVQSRYQAEFSRAHGNFLDTKIRKQPMYSIFV